MELFAEQLAGVVDVCAHDGLFDIGFYSDPSPKPLMVKYHTAISTLHGLYRCCYDLGSQSQIISMREFGRIVREYYQEHRRLLPWRVPEANGSFDVYKILVSEIMLQQTQVKRVVPKYQAFLRQFPDIGSLADAPLADVLIAWSGLGYNRRPKYLHDAAKKLVLKARPWSIKDLTACKGIGYNTAAAVLVYAYNQPHIFIETNVRSVYIHHFVALGSDTVADKELVPFIEQTLDYKRPREFYWALMDYGTHLKATIGNTATRSQQYAKQSAFEGSRRQIRGQILRALSQKPMSLRELRQRIQDQRVPDVLSSLEAERLITRPRTCYMLAR